MKRILTTIGTLIVASILFVGCGISQSDTNLKEQKITEDNQARLSRLYPIPQMDTSLERDIVVQLYELRNQARNTHSVILSDGTATPVWDCPSIGFPIANDVQLTNPEQIAVQNQYGVATLPQAEPNGLYTPASSWGTWVLCAEGDGSIAPVYNEADTITFPFPVKVDYITGRITRDGPATATVTLK